jgi:hypothetical protein
MFTEIISQTPLKRGGEGRSRRSRGEGRERKGGDIKS